MAESRKNTTEEPAPNEINPNAIYTTADLCRIFGVKRTAPNEINPNAIYTTADLCRIFGVKRTTIVRWRAERGLPLGGAPKGHITGRAILDWVENGKVSTSDQPTTAAS